MGDDGSPRKVHKLDKQTWRVDTAGCRALTVRYAIYGHDLTVRTNHIDDTHAFLHGPATFVYPVHLRRESVAVEIRSQWPVTTALSREGNRYVAASIDELFDHPIHVGDVATYNVPAKVPVELAIWGQRAPGGMFDEARADPPISPRSSTITSRAWARRRSIATCSS